MRLLTVEGCNQIFHRVVDCMTRDSRMVEEMARGTH